MRVPIQVMRRLEERARRSKVTVEDLLLRALVKVLEEG